jgi:chemotaxis protein histidine kinase CheA
MGTVAIVLPADPAPIPNARPYDLIREHIEELFDEAKNHADGDPIATPGQAEAVQTLLRQIQAAKKAADAERVKENEPFDTGKAEVQSRYASLIGDTKTVKGKAVLAEDVLKAHLLPWQIKLADEQRAAADAARAEAQRLAELAAAAHQSAAANDLEAREDAEALVSAAKAAEKAAKAAETARPQVAGQGRAATLRTSYRAVLKDAQVAAGAYWKRDPSAFNAFLQGLADADVASGRREIPGFTVEEVRSVV